MKINALTSSSAGYRPVQIHLKHCYAEDEVFVPARGDRPAQSRIFVDSPSGSVPELVVYGSMVNAATGERVAFADVARPAKGGVA